MASETRQERQEVTAINADVEDADGASNLAGALAATVRQAASEMPRDTPMSLVYWLSSPDDTSTR